MITIITILAWLVAAWVFFQGIVTGSAGHVWIGLAGALVVWGLAVAYDVLKGTGDG